MNEENVLLVHNYDHNGVPVVAAQGDVDLCTQGILREALMDSGKQASESDKIAVDMREVPFIDSAGLALLVEIRKHLMSPEQPRPPRQLALIIAARSQPERVLKLGRFDTFLQVCYNPDELTGAPAAAPA